MHEHDLFSVIHLLLWHLGENYNNDRCQDGWRALDHHCYMLKIIPDASFPADSPDCDGGRLTSIWTKAEWDFILNEVVIIHLSSILKDADWAPIAYTAL